MISDALSEAPSKRSASAADRSAVEEALAYGVVEILVGGDQHRRQVSAEQELACAAHVENDEDCCEDQPAKQTREHQRLRKGERR